MPKLRPADWRASIPGSMRALPRWVGRVDKLPVHPVRETAARAGVPATWGTFQEAAEFYDRHATDPERGAGFEFAREDGLVGVDLDLALDPAGCPYDWAVPILASWEALGGAYVEVSPSGRGLHLITRARLPRNPNRVDFGGVVEAVDGKQKKSGVEVYCDKRYFTVTGDVWQGLGEVGDGQALLDDLLRATGLDARLRDREAPAATGAEPHRAEEVRAALAKLDPDLSYPEWIEVGMAAKAGLGDAGLPIWVEWCGRGSKYRRGEPEEKWRSFGGSGVGLGTLFKRALDSGWQFPEVSAAEEFAAFADDDFSDLLGGREVDAFAEVDPDAIPYHRTKKGIVKSAGNIELYFSRDPEWRGRLRYNTRRGVELDGEVVDDNGFTRLGTAVERAVGFDGAAAIDHVYRGVVAAAREREYDPVKEYILAEEWDRVPRIDDWLVRAGAPDTRENRVIARRFLIGAAGRALCEPQPDREPLDGQGTKMDYVLVLEGEQGQKKSWVCQALCPPSYFFDSHFDFTHGSKDFYQALGANFIVEMAELDALTRAEVTTVKAIITSRVDQYRAPYGRVIERHPRRSVMVGTTNEREWNRDLTGARRFWPVALWGCRLDVGWLLDNRPQLWAEAAALYRSGECYWEDEVMSAMMEPIQAARSNTPGWMPLVEEFIGEPSVAARGYVTPSFIVQGLRFLGGVPSNDLGRVLRRLGCRPETPKIGGRTFRVWVLPGGPATHAELTARIEKTPLPVEGSFEVLPP